MTPQFVSCRRVVWSGTQWVGVTNGVFNASDFNVPTDGVSDCGPAISYMLTAAATEGGGKLVFGHYTYVINSQITWPTNGSYITWEGLGKGLTQFVSTFNGGSSTMATVNISADSNGPPLTNITFRGCTFAGQANSDTGGAFKFLYFGYTVNQILIEDCEFYWATAAAVHLSAIDSTGAGTYGDRLLIDNCYFHDIGTSQMATYLSGAAIVAAAQEIVITNSRFENIGDIQVSATVTEVQLTSNTATLTANNTFQVGWEVNVSGLSSQNSEFNGTWTITNVTSTNFSFALTHPDVPPTIDNGTAATIQNNFHAVYNNAQSSIIVANNFFVGLCSRLHLYGSGTTEPAVNSRPTLIAGNTFDGIYGHGLTNVFWNSPNAEIVGNVFYNTGINVGCDGVHIVGNEFYVDANVPIYPPSPGSPSFLVIEAGSSASNVVVRGNRIVSAIPASTSLVFGVFVSAAGCQEWTIEDNTFDSDINENPNSDIVAVYISAGGSHFITDNRIRTNLRIQIIHLAGNAGGSTLIRHNSIEVNVDGNYQPIWDETQNPTNLLIDNRSINDFTETAGAAIGVIATNWDGSESAPTSYPQRVGQRCYRNLAASSTWTPGAVAAGGTVSTTVPVTGAMPGNVVQCEFGAAGDVPIIMSGRVTAPNTVTVWGFNASGSSQTLNTAGNLRVNVRQMWPDWGDGTTASVGTATFSGATLAPSGPSSTVTTTVTLTGANTCNIGDAVAPSLPTIGSAIVSLSGYVSAPNTVVVTATNLSGATVTLTGPTLLSVQTRPV